MVAGNVERCEMVSSLLALKEYSIPPETKKPASAVYAGAIIGDSHGLPSAKATVFSESLLSINCSNFPCAKS